MTGRLDEFRVGWPIVLAGFVGVTLGVLSLPATLLGPLAKPLEAAFGWSRAGIMTSLSMLAVGTTLGTPLAGRLADRFDPRLLVMASALLLGLLFLIVSQLSGALWQFQGLYLAIGLLCSGSGGVIYTRVIGQHFHQARGTAIGIVLSGAGAGIFAVPLLAHAIDAAVGWRFVFVALAALILLVGLPVIHLGLRRAGSSEARSHSVDGTMAEAGFTRSAAMRDIRFWLMVLSVSLFGLFIGSLLLNLMPMLIDLGAPAGRAAQLASLVGIALLIGRLTIGMLLDHFLPSNVGACALALGALGTFLFVTAGLDFAIFTVLAIGLIIGAEIDLISFLSIRYFGVGHYGEIFGLIFAFFTASSIVGPLLGAALIAGGGYETLYWGATGAFAAAALAMLALSAVEAARARRVPATSE